ncbi:beta-conglycinin beta subunit 1-like [Neltuma alba]|uniref:beta-conglycinin beta subunit 1-like n=1 Tax=Neltuma alba TaxID=207710 RepID=UPI0010A427C4|nr:beta-conglycinin beta subunit 1-like [Prosopis alba]
MGCFKARLPVLLLLGSVFLAVASVGLAHWEDDENSEYRVCVKNCVFQSDASRSFDCPARCRPKRERHGEKEEAAERDPRLPDPRHPWRPGQTEEGEGEETEGQKPQWQREREQQQGPHQQPRPLRPEEGKEGQQERPQRQPRPWRPEEGEERQQERPQRQPRPGRPEEREEGQQERPHRQSRPGRPQEGEEGQKERPQRQSRPRRPEEGEEGQQERPHRQSRPGRPQEGEEEQQERPHRQPRPWRPEEREEGQQERPERQPRPWRPEEREQEQEGQGEEQKQQRENPYYLPSNRFETRFSNEHGQIRVLQKFDQLSPDLRMLRYYRIVEFRSRPSTLVVPHHSDAEYLIINTKGRAIVTLVLPNYKESFNLEQFDVLRVPAGAICYTINRASSQDLEFIKLALPVNIPGQFENFYPSGNQIPNSYLKAFNRKTLQAAFNAPYEEIEQAFWGTEQQQQQQGQQGSEEGVIVRLPREQLRSLISRAQSRQRREEKSSPLGPFNLKNIQPRYSNNHGTFREAHPQRFEALQDLGIGVSHLRLNEGSMFLPHYNTRAIILAFVAEGQGHTEMACPHLASPEEQEGECGCRARRQREGEQEHREGQFRRVAAQLSKGDFYVVPAGHPVAVRASKNSNLEVVEFVLNAPYNFRNFLAGKSQNVLNELDREVKEAAFEGSGEQVERLLNRQKESFFVDREEQPSRGGRSPRQTNKVAWSSILTAFM